MYSVGQQVIYGIHGVCDIIGIEERSVDRKTVPYFVLVPRDHPDSRYYLPSLNPAALKKIRPLTKKEDLLRYWSEPLDESRWIPAENKRKQVYRDLIAEAQADCLVHILRCLSRYKAELDQVGKKFHLSDDNFMRDARRILAGEMAVVLDIEQRSALKTIDGLLEDALKMAAV